MGDTRLELGNADPIWRPILEEATRAVFAEGADATPCPECGDRENRVGIPMASMPLDLPSDVWTWLPGPCVMIHCGNHERGRRPLISIYHPTHARQESTLGPARLGGHRAL